MTPFTQMTQSQGRSVRACVHSVGMLCGYMPNSSFIYNHGDCASITLAFCQSFCMVRRLGPWQQRLRRHSTLLINGVYAASWIYTGQSASPTTRSDQEPNSDYSQSAPDAFASLVTSAELTPVRIILGHCTPVLLVCPSTAGRPRQTWLRTTENDLRPNLGLVTAERRAQNRTAWQTLVEMATSLTSSGWWWW